MKDTIKKEYDDWLDYIQQSKRLQISTYIDKSFLQNMIDSLLIRDSVIIIAEDKTLREAQEAISKYNDVFILLVTERKNPSREKRVISAQSKNQIL
jgi:hypothetical protein